MWSVCNASCATEALLNQRASGMIENPDRPVVYIVDDDLSVRDALRNLCRSIGLAVQTFATAREFLDSKHPEAPGCLVLDVRLPGPSGLDLQRQLIRADIRIPIIFVTGHGDIQMSVRAMKAGAVDFLAKPFRDQDLLDAVQAAIRRDAAARQERAARAEVRARYDSLTSREQEVFLGVVQGLLNKQIGDELSITEPTIKLHRARLMQKMEAESLADLVHMAEELGIPRGRRRPLTPSGGEVSAPPSSEA
jgi:FixJ family two-component response regulator